MKSRTRTIHKRPAAVQGGILTLETSAARVASLANELRARLGIEPVQIERPGETVRWLELYFPNEVTAWLAARALGTLRGVRAFKVRGYGEQDWLSFWRRHFKSMDIGRRLQIVPSWERTRPHGKRRRVIIDPGMSFGTGGHFTTRFCLEALDRLCAPGKPPRAVWDVGTGSGILAIAAARLGCPRVLGTDNDAQALKAAAENVALNRVGARIKLRVSDVLADAPPGSFDIVCANLYGGLLLQLAPLLSRAARRHIVLSGLREFEADAVADAFVATGAREVMRDGDGEWAGILLNARKP